VIDVEPALDASLAGRDQIDHAAARAKLDQPDLLDTALLDEPQDASIEVVCAILIAASQDHVIEFRNLEWNFHIAAPGL
jgi:hypothetical protein